jgi:hypothetical protein
MLLVSRLDSLAPTASVHCNHFGVRLRQQQAPAAQFWGVNQLWANALGLLVGLGVVSLLVYGGHVNWLGGLISWSAGLSCLAVGAVIVLASRWMLRLAD